MEMEIILHRVKKRRGNRRIIMLPAALMVMLTVIGYILPRDADAQTEAFIAFSAGRIASREALLVRQLRVPNSLVHSAGRNFGTSWREDE